MNEKVLLTLDALVNLVLGIPLALLPHQTIALLGLPATDHTFYTSLLGALLIGIGLALLVELFTKQLRVTGLGLGGAVVINFSGAGVLTLLLLLGSWNLPLRGMIFLWALAAVVLLIGVVELAAYQMRIR